MSYFIKYEKVVQRTMSGLNKPILKANYKSKNKKIQGNDESF